MGRIIPAPQKKKRGRARPEKQLSELQLEILYWLLEKSRDLIGQVDTPYNADNLGVNWSAKEFLAFFGKEIKYKSTKVIISKSLERLDLRGLIVRLKTSGKTTMIFLTALGLKIIFEHWMKIDFPKKETKATHELPIRSLNDIHYESFGRNSIAANKIMLRIINSMSEKRFNETMILMSPQGWTVMWGKIHSCLESGDTGDDAPICESKKDWVDYLAGLRSS